MGQASSLPGRRQEGALERGEGVHSAHTGHHNATTDTSSISSTNPSHSEENNTESAASTVNISRAGRFRRHLTAFSRLGLSPSRHHSSSSVSRIPYSIGTRRRSVFGSSISRRNTIFELPPTHFSIPSNQLTTVEPLDLHALNPGDYSFTIRDLPLVSVPGIESYISERSASDLSTNTEHQLLRGIIRQSRRNTLSRNTRRTLEISGRIRTNNDAIMQQSFNRGGLNTITHHPGEDQAAMLSRLLSVAAAATAASLVGNNEQAIAEAQDITMSQNPSSDRDSHIIDGSFESFLRALQNGRLAAALRNGGSENGGGIPNENEETGSIQPLNFFRMFRFGNSQQGNAQEGNDDLQNPRLVPIIIVGIRSVPPRDITNTAAQHASPFFDTLANLSVNMPLNYESSYQRNMETQQFNEQGVFTDSSGTSISMSERTIPNSSNVSGENVSNEGPSDYLRSSRLPASTSNSQNPELVDRTVQANSNASIPVSLDTSHIQHRSSSYLESLFSQRPQTMNDRVENRNPINSNHSGHYNDNTRGTNSNDTTGVDNNSSRISSSGSGTSNNTTSRSGSSSNDGRHNSTRSWIIYVLGGSYPEDHPILTTPSLFTDSPTYEDMLLLSSLIGPAKAPVATKDEIESAGGLHVLSVNSSAADIYLEERCVICLNNYEIGEECRELSKCKHFFHKACIDEWLMTGRNTCPTCRAEGVNSRKNDTSTSNIMAEESNMNITMTGI